ncbi:hypothetical protein QE152_g29914 [Popillia japonica]|uniref:Uncharacterized protein n=1 Tax=Popillia japonica TaxID=7064 RepID=A0AAW1JGU1_POPJA
MNLKDAAFIITESWNGVSVLINDKEEDWDPEDNLPLDELIDMLKRTETTQLTPHEIEEWIAENPDDNTLTDEEIINKPKEKYFNNDNDDAGSSTKSISVKTEDALNAIDTVIQWAEVNSTTSSRLLVLNAIDTVIQWAEHSVVASDKLRSLQAQQSIPLLHLKQDVPTRWNSTVIMIERLIEMKNVLTEALTALSTVIMIERLIEMKNVLTEALTALSRVADLLDEMEWNILLDCLSTTQL